MKIFRAILAGLGAAISVDSALACSPLPAGWAEKAAENAAAQVDKKRTSLVEAVVVSTGRWPEFAALRVVRAHWGKLKKNAVIVIQPQPGSMCGPGLAVVGERGFLQLTEEQLRQRPVPFYGFMNSLQVTAYRRKRLLSR